MPERGSAPPPRLRRVTDAPQIHSGGFHIAFDLPRHQSLGYVLPEWLEEAQVQQAEQAAAASRLRLGASPRGGSSSSSSSSSSHATKIVLPFKQSLLADSAAAAAAEGAAGGPGSAAAAALEGSSSRALRHKFADVQPALLLFLRRLRCIAITDTVEPALSSIMARRQLAPGLLELSSGRDGQQRSRCAPGLCLLLAPLQAAVLLCPRSGRAAAPR